MRHTIRLAIAKLTGNTQKYNRLKLAKHLERNVTDEQYNHRWYWLNANESPSGIARGCALGHAATAGIGGMYFEAGIFNIPRSKANPGPRSSADAVFGVNAYDTIFDTHRRFTRQQAIAALRNFA